MARRFIGQAVIEVEFDDNYKGDPDRYYYKGHMSAGGKSFTSGGFGSPCNGWGPGVAADSSEAYDRVSVSVVEFFTYFTTGNRRNEDNLGDYPPPEMADVFAEAVVEARGDDKGRLEVRRRKDGPVALVGG